MRVNNFALGRCEGVYCRYAMSANTREGGYSIVSIEPHLLGSSLPRFYAPGIQTRLFDLTPEIAGPSEGFIEAGVAVHAIFGSTDTIRATICSAWLVGLYRQDIIYMLTSL
jgi:hypothetical protein